ncbi:MAG: T9SS type A sorting domain-containing protein [Lewinella sp.]
MRILFFLVLITINAPLLYAQGVVVDITRAGVGAVPDGDCRIDLRVSDCQQLDGMQTITVAPGQQVALFLEWQNAGSADFREVRATDQNNDEVFPPVTSTLFPNETAFRNTFFEAPTMPGTYATLVTLTAIDFNDREDTDQYRFFIIVDESLPVELADFQAQLSEKGEVDLFWRTLEERDNDHFVVERSRHGSTFTEVGAVAGARESLTEQAYTFRDPFPLPGRSFYRLRQVDRDGTATLSQVVSVEVDRGLTLYPNPTEGQLSIAGFAGGRVDVYDSLGRRILGQNLAKDGTLDVTTMASGRYLLRTDAGSRWWIKR